MKDWQKIIKYLAIAFAVFLTVSIIGGILSAVGLLGGIFGGSSSDPGEMKSYEFDDSIRVLDLEIGAAELTVKTGPALKVETDIKSVTVKENGDTLTIKEKSFGIHRTEATLILTLPEGFSFREADLETGAGNVTIEDLAADRLSLELGAGKATLSGVTVSSSADIDGGAGKLVIEKSEITDLELDMGVGELELSAALSGENDIDLGVGKATLTLLGEKEDYRVRLNKGMGEASIDGESVSDGIVIGSGSTRLQIDGGVGEVTVNFENQSKK